MTGPAPALAASRDAAQRQYDILWRERWQRIGLTSFAYLLCTIYLPFWVCAICGLVNVLAEIASMRILERIDPERERGQFGAVLVMIFVVEVAYCIPPALIWQMDHAYAKPFALGMVMMTLLHLTTVRAILLPTGVAGLMGVAFIVLFANGIYWALRDELWGLAASTAIAVAGLAYCLTAMISNHALHRATADGQRQARAADAAKSRFLAQMSHELRTPLTAILGIGELEWQGASRPESRERLDVLVQAARGLGIVLDDILDMSALDAGQAPIRATDGTPAHVVAQSVDLFRPQADRAGLDLRFEVSTSAPPPPLARFDAQRLRQCVSNLVSNALKFTREGHITVSVAAAGPVLTVKVCDTGPGVDPEAAAAIFDPFVQGDPTAGGTGLGLTISRSLAREMGGDLRLLPPEAPGSGAGFELTIRLDTPTGEAVAPVPPRRLDGCRVLVVDDIATNTFVAAAHLRALGAEVVTAEGGTAALQRLDETPVDLVLLDMNMPPPDGMATFRAIRARGLPVKVVAMTAAASDAERTGFLAAGIDGFLPKPISSATLAHVLAETGIGRPARP